MKIEKTIEENHEAKLIVEVEPEKMDTYKRRAARKISERGKIAGFRPGKAPYHMVVLNYGEQAVVEQAIDFFVDAEYPNILKGADVNPGGSGSLESIDSNEPPKLTFKVPLAPEVDLGDYHSIRMPYEWSAPYKEGSYTGPGGATTTRLESHKVNVNGRSGLWMGTYPFANSPFNSFYPKDIESEKLIGSAFVLAPDVPSASDVVGGKVKIFVKPNPYKRSAGQ